MSKSQEFEHGTGHKFSVKRLQAGEYKSCCGHKIESRQETPGYGSGTVWNITHPGQRTPDDVVYTLKDAKESIAQIHKPNKESNDWSQYS
jgi:hypothetical protein